MASFELRREVLVTSLRRKLERRKKKQGSGRGFPRVSNVELTELKAILERAKTGALANSDVDKLESAVDTLALLTQELEAKGASIRRLRRWLFGSTSEKTSRVVGAEGSTASGDVKKLRLNRTDNLALLVSL